jgi:hypothetical protein
MNPKIFNLYYNSKKKKINNSVKIPVFTDHYELIKEKNEKVPETKSSLQT